MAAYTVETWLRGMVDFDFTPEALAAILFNRGIEAGTAASDLSEKQRDLCYADILMYAAGSSVKSSGEYISDNGYQLQKSAKNVFDRKSLRDQAMRLYAKWNDPRAEEAAKSKFKLRDLYK
ncbi:MAG: hypothetical protein ACI3ZT_00925 [Candidatus Cryptobacteroides sp.]